MPEGIEMPEVAKEISEHKERSEGDAAHHEPHGAERWVSIAEAVLLSVVALIAAGSGYSAAKWGTRSSISLAHASAARTKSSLAETQALQIRTLDSVSFNAAFTAYATTGSINSKVFKLAVKRMRPGYLVAFHAWLATHPLTNPHAPPGPSYMPQYVIPQQAESVRLDNQANRFFTTGEVAAGTSDKYVRLTVVLAAVLFLFGIGSRIPVKASRYVILVVATALLIISLVELISLPGPPA
jgi:hypothetical protein